MRMANASLGFTCASRVIILVLVPTSWAGWHAQVARVMVRLCTASFALARASPVLRKSVHTLVHASFIDVERRIDTSMAEQGQGTRCAFVEGLLYLCIRRFGMLLL